MMYPARLMSLVLALALFGGAPAALAQARRKPAADEQVGLKVGAKAPTFTLKDQEGKDRSLDEFVKKGTVALVFFRSADW
jgi:cytochrome oxidase Cu insertion factor (SCO1/SenC/PrrC family)